MSATPLRFLTLLIVLPCVVAQATVINNYNSDCRAYKAGTSAVVFSVGRQSEHDFKATARLPMEIEFFNEGKYFDMSSNIFTAPVTGIYYFSFTSAGPPGKQIELRLFAGKPEVQVARAFNYNTASYRSTSASVYIKLAKGEMASLWVKGGMKAYGTRTAGHGPSTMFNGQLVQALT